MISDLENNGFIKLNDIKIKDIDAGILEIEVKEKHLNPYNIVHGGVLYTLADTAMGLSLISAGEYVTVDATINYLRPAFCSLLKTEVNKIKIGKSVATLTCNIYDEFDKLICISTGNYHIRK